MTIVGKKFDVLDDGFVRVVDFMGNDDSIVQAARISYGKGTKRVSEDRGLIRYLLRHRHTTPFEMCEIKLHVRAPMDVWRQWIRHRTANVNEYSTRYSEAIDATHTTKPAEWRRQSKTNRQGSTDFFDIEVGKELSQKENEYLELSAALYKERIDKGVAREQARKDLPLSTYTEAYWKIDLHNLLHFLSLRMDAHAQQEIREYAVTIGTNIVAKWCPVTWEAFGDYCLQSLTLSRLESEVIRSINEGRIDDSVELAKSFGWLSENGSASVRNRELQEFSNKAKLLGIILPWNENGTANQ